MVDDPKKKWTPEVIEAVRTLVRNNIIEEYADGVRIPRVLVNLAIARASELTPEGLRELWNRLKDRRMSKAESLNDKRRSAARARLKTYPAMSQWVWLIQKMNKSDWCLGMRAAGSDKRYANWVANFDYLIKPATMLSWREGKMDWSQTKEPEQEDRVESRSHLK